MQFNILTLTLQHFVGVFSGGFGRMSSAVHALLAALVGIDLLLMGFWWALGGGEQLAAVFKKILYIGFWIWLVQSFPGLAKSFVDSLVSAGLMAGGGGVSVSQIMDPSALAGAGLDATEPLAKKLSDMGTFDIADMIVYGVGYIAIMACYLIMAINLFLAVLEYYLFAGVVGILLPFGLLPSTKFLAEKAIGAVVAAGIKLMVLSFITSAVVPIVMGSHFSGAEIGFNELWAMLLTMGGVTVLCWKAPSMASNLMAGAPSLGASDAARVGQSALGAGAAVGGAFTGNPAAVSSGMRAAAGGGATGATAKAGGLGAATPVASASSALPRVGAPVKGPATPAASASLVRSLGGEPKAAPTPPPASEARTVAMPSASSEAVTVAMRALAPQRQPVAPTLAS